MIVRSDLDLCCLLFFVLVLLFCFNRSATYKIFIFVYSVVAILSYLAIVSVRVVGNENVNSEILLMEESMPLYIEVPMSSQ